ncbi:MAG: hypothetical protein ACJASM_000740 [Salibacteraceae bacterium]|jgi:hypothetical protein
MSKRALKKYLQELTKEQLEEQCMDLYLKFKEVKTYYNFVFNPDEKKLLEEAKVKISQEYYPTGKRRRPKMRRTVAQKFIKHFVLLGVDPMIIGDLMFYNIEIAQTYRSHRTVHQDSFYTSMLRSFEQALAYTKEQDIYFDFKERAELICKTTEEQEWFNQEAFWAVKGE